MVAFPGLRLLQLLRRRVPFCAQSNLALESDSVDMVSRSTHLAEVASSHVQIQPARSVGRPDSF